MVNPLRGEVELVIDGERHILKLTLGALAELEDSLKSGTLIDLIQRFESDAFSTRDVLSLIVAGLRGGGWQGHADDLLAAHIEGGAIGAARAAAQLLARAFVVPEAGTDAVA